MLPINGAQRQLIVHYKEMDPDVQLLGYHRNRPVVYAFTDRAGQFRAEHRQVIVIQRNGEPGDLPENWTDEFVFHPQPASELRRGTVYAIVREWHARVTR